MRTMTEIAVAEIPLWQRPPHILTHTGNSPMPADEAVWVRDHVITARRDVRVAERAAQQRCLHLPAPICSGCRHGYHGGCSGRSWGDMHLTWIRDRSGSWVYWAGPLWRQNVWIAPIPCQCECPAEPVVEVARQLDIFGELMSA